MSEGPSTLGKGGLETVAAAPKRTTHDGRRVKALDLSAETLAPLRQRLRRYLQARLADPASAEDLVQDVFVKALTSQARGPGIDQLGAWLLTAARHALIDHYRARAVRREAGDLDEEVLASWPAPDGHGGDGTSEAVREHRALALCLRPLIEQLPPRYRDTLIGAELEGRSLRSLAEAEGVSVSALKSRAARGRAMLKAQLLACCEVEAAGGWVQGAGRCATQVVKAAGPLTTDSQSAHCACGDGASDACLAPPQTKSGLKY